MMYRVIFKPNIDLKEGREQVFSLVPVVDWPARNAL